MYLINSVPRHIIRLLGVIAIAWLLGSSLAIAQNSHSPTPTAGSDHPNILWVYVEDTNDKGRFPESDAGLRAVLDRWGEQAVNKEYDRVRSD